MLLSPIAKAADSCQSAAAVAVVVVVVDAAVEYLLALIVPWLW